MKTWMKFALVIGGYVLAFVAGGLAEWSNDVRVAKLPYDTSGGMYAGGAMMAWLGAFLLVATVPTLLAMWFVRRHEGVWRAVATGILVFAGAGLLAVLMPLVIHGKPTFVPLLLFSLLGLVQLLGVPLWLGGCVVLAYFAPTPRVRRLLVAAAGLEVVIAVCAYIHWNVPLPPL